MIKVIHKKGYLYSLWSGRLVIYEGDIIQHVRIEDLGVFRAKTKGVLCSLEPGIVYNAVVWLPEKDDEFAKNILIEYEKQSIAKLQEKIENHLHKIKILEES